MKTLLAVLSLAIAAPASAAWRRVDSANFVVVGDVGARDLRAIATRFELFHEALGRVLGATGTTPSVPTVVIVFPNEEAFTPYQPVYRGKARTVAGYAVSGQDANYIAMLNVRGEFSDRIIFHEFTHLVVANAVARTPVWLNEGLAEFYSTFAVMDGGKRAQIGRPIIEHFRLLDGSIRVPLADLLKVDATSPRYNEGDTAGEFYAESWALTHMLISVQPSRVPKLGEYLQRVASGASESEAWTAVFGTRMEEELRLYLKRPIVNTMVVEFPEKAAAHPMSDAPLSQADTAAFLAALQLRRQNTDAAARLLEPALASQPDAEMANAVMAGIELAKRNPSAAAARLMRLAQPKDWLAAYTSALALIHAIDQERDMPSAGAVIATVTALLEHVRRESPDLPNALAAQAQIEMYGDKTPSPAARANIARARALAPGRVDYALIEAQLYAEARDFSHARSVIGPLMTPVYPEDVRNAARRLMAGLVDLEKAVSRTNGAAAPTGRSRSVAVPDADAGRPRASSGEGRFRPIYRTLQAGEQRLDGTLERIDCAAAGKPAVFHVRAAGAMVDLEGQLADVDLISYRDDLTGGVSCGERDPMRVYVTWREGASSRHGKVVVAVEFLPKD
jgi:hypothetical protein